MYMVVYNEATRCKLSMKIIDRKILQTYWQFLKMTSQAYFSCSITPSVEVKFLSSAKHPSFIMQITTLRLAIAFLGKLLAFDLLHNIFALQTEVVIETLREDLGVVTKIMSEAGSSEEYPNKFSQETNGMYY